MKNMTRPLNLCDLDFTDLHSDDDKDDLMPRGFGGAMVIAFVVCISRMNRRITFDLI